MKKIQTIYELTPTIKMVVNEEFEDHICLIEYGDTCSGIMRHWGVKKDIIDELMEVVKKLEESNT